MLDRILAAARERAETLPAERELRAKAADAPPVRGFQAALAGPGLSVIAEIKRRSPFPGDLDPDLDPARLAASYQEGGAAALSVLTEPHFFSGSDADLAQARAACDLPVLRKDFTLVPAQVWEARAIGADAVLLIVAALDDPTLRRLLETADEAGLAALVEVHDEQEAERAVEAGARLVGVNNRDLRTFTVDLAVAEKLAPALVDVPTKVAESGIAGPDDARRMAAAGYDAVLVGEWLVTRGDPAPPSVRFGGAMTWVKVCGIRTEEALAAAEEAGADAVGFVLADSPRRVTVLEARRLAARTGLETILVTVDTPPDRVFAWVDEVGATGVQPHGRYSALVAEAATGRKLRVLRPVPVADRVELAGIPTDQVPLLDTADPDRHGGTGRRFAWDLAAGLDRPWVLAGGLGPEDVADAVARLRPWGVDASSRLESEPGVKDPDRIRRFVEEAKSV